MKLKKNKPISQSWSSYRPCLGTGVVDPPRKPQRWYFWKNKLYIWNMSITTNRISWLCGIELLLLVHCWTLISIQLIQFKISRHQWWDVCWVISQVSTVSDLKCNGLNGQLKWSAAVSAQLSWVLSPALIESDLLKLMKIN